MNLPQTFHPLAGFAVTLALLAADLPAQQAWPTNAVYAVANFGQQAPPDRVIGFDAAYNPVYNVVIPGADSPDSICMDPRNDTLLIGDTTGVQPWRLAGGAMPAFIPLAPGGSITWVDVDEDGGIIWCTSSGRIYHAPSLGGAASRLRNDGFVYNAIAWNGSTGGYVAVRFSAVAANGEVHFFDRDGTHVRISAGIDRLSGVDWDPFTGHLIISRFGGLASAALGAVTQSGAQIPYMPGGVATATANSVEVIENPQPGVALDPRLIGIEYGAAPRHIYRKVPGFGAPLGMFVHANFGPSDLEVVRSRQVWGLNEWRQGKTAKLSVNFGPARALQRYKVLLSMTGHTPGIPVGAAGTLHLVWDPLFLASFMEISPPFHFFSGVLDAAGRAVPDPRVDIPNGAAGLRIWAGAVTLAGGVTQASNCYGATIQP